MGRRIISPSFIGLRPRFASRMAFSMSLMTPLSQGLMVISRGSGTVTLATPLQRRGRAVVVDPDAVEHAGAGAAGADLGQLPA